MERDEMGWNLKQYLDYVEKSQTRKLVYYGAGEVTRTVLENHYSWHQPSEVAFICDSDNMKWGHEIEGVMIVSPDELLKDPDAYVVIIMTNARAWYYAKCIYRRLKDMHIPYVYYDTILWNAYKEDRYRVVGNGTPFFHEFRSFPLIENNMDKIFRVRDMLADERSKTIYDRYVFCLKYNLNWFFYADISDDVCDNYFSDALFEYEDEEVLIDGGSYDGGDVIHFDWVLRNCGKRLKKSYSFEPDSESFVRVSEDIIEEIGLENAKPAQKDDSVWRADRFVVYRAGLDDMTREQRFASTGKDQMGSQFFRDTTRQDEERLRMWAKDICVAKTVRLDDVVADSDRVTFVKFDLEGYDYSALQGAKKIIQRDKPKLALSIYHEIEDLWRIPLLVKDYVPEYKIFIRHHAPNKFEKMMYAYV